MPQIPKQFVTLRIIWHEFLRSIWHNGEPSEQRDSDLASFQDGALDLARAQSIKMREFSKLATRLLFREYHQERFLRSVSSSSSGSACACEWTLEIGRSRMGALHPFLKVSDALNWNSTGFRELLSRPQLVTKLGLGDPVVGNISLHLFIPEHRVQERNHTVPWI
jgi:hypothetical protein